MCKPTPHFLPTFTPFGASILVPDSAVHTVFTVSVIINNLIIIILCCINYAIVIRIIIESET